MGVKTKRGGDNKLRKTGDVGSHSTLVTEARTPTTNINKVNIPSKKVVIKAYGQSRKVASNAAAAPWLDSISSLNEAKTYLNVVLAAEQTAKAEFGKIISVRMEDKYEPNITKGDAKDQNYLNVRSNLTNLITKREQLQAFIEEKTDRDNRDKALAEVELLESKNPEFAAINAELEKHPVDSAEWNAVLLEGKKILSKDPELSDAILKLDEAIDKSSESRKNCQQLGIRPEQLLQ